MNKVYIVVGLTGEYSDRNKWNVTAYPDKQVADQHARLANEWCEEKGVGPDDRDKLPHYEQRQRLTRENPYDRRMEIDYTGTWYVVAEADFSLHVDQYMGLD